MHHRLVVFIGAVVAVAACASRPVRPAPPNPWSVTVSEAAQQADVGQYARADSLVAAFVANNPTSPDTLEAIFWRALYRADPGNPDSTGPVYAQALVDRYLRGEGAPARRYEAALVRRVAVLRSTPPPVRVDTVRTVDSAAVRTLVAREVEARDRLRDEEIQRVRDSLTRTTAELERIRRALRPAAPRP